MKKLFSFSKRKQSPSGTPDPGNVLSVGYEVKEKDLGKLHKAAWKGDVSKLEHLVKNNDVNQVDKQNRTALHIACASGNYEVVKFLVEKKAKLNLSDNQNRTPLMKAVQGQHDVIVNILLENHAEPNLVDMNGNTALHLASSIPSISIVDILQKYDADINVHNKEGLSPLTLSVQEDYLDVAEFLLKKGADVNTFDKDQRSPLMIAAGNGQISMVRMLLQFDADITLEDSKGQLAEDYAAMESHHPCALLIAEHYAKRNQGASPSHPGPSKKKTKAEGGNPSRGLNTGLSVGGPATDKDDFEDNSQAESLSRISKKCGTEEWASSEDDCESLIVEKTPPKMNLRKMLESQRGKAFAVLDKSVSGSESESDNSAPRVASSKPPVEPSPLPFLSQASQMTSTPLPTYSKAQESSDAESKDSDKEEDGEEVEEEQEQEEEEDLSGDEPEESGGLLHGTPGVPKDMKKVSGLEKEDEDSWDSEHEDHSEDKLSVKAENQDETPDIGDTLEEDLLYTPSFLRGGGAGRWMPEPWWSKGLRSPAAKHKDDDNGSVQMVGGTQKESENTKWGLLLSKCEGKFNEKTADLMEELGLGDFDYAEDGSEWDTSSNASKRSFPGYTETRPAPKEVPECISKEEEVGPKAAITTLRKVGTDEKQAPHPQPRTKKMGLQESDKLDRSASPCNEAKIDNHQPQAAVIANFPVLLTSGSKHPLQSDEQQQQVDQVTYKAAVSMKNISDYSDTGGRALKEHSNKKPETSSSRPLVESQLSLKAEEKTVEKTSLPTAVGKACGTPQTEARQLSLFDDSTLSDVTDDEERCQTGEEKKKQNLKEVKVSEDMDELNSSSDMTTDDSDFSHSGHGCGSLFIQNLDSVTTDSRSMVKLQNIFHKYERSIQKAKSRHAYFADKVSLLETEKVQLRSSLDEVKDVKSTLERNQLELQTEVTNLRFQLKQEQENSRNANMMFSTTGDKLRRTEEQRQLEVQEKQKVELTLRNLELEMRILLNFKKQLEEDQSQTQTLLAQERSARTVLENLLNSHVRKKQEIEEENKRNINKSSEALSQLTEASDRERELLQQISIFKEQLSTLKTDLENSQASSSIKQRDLQEENNAVKEQLDEARRALRVNNDTLNQTILDFNNQMAALKSELTMTANRLDNERQTRETMAVELESVRTRLTVALQEAKRCMAAQSDTEKSLLREKEEHHRLKDRLSSDTSSQHEAVSSLSQKLAKAEARANSTENQAHQATMQLTEKNLVLNTMQRENDQIAARVKELEAALRAEKELVTRAAARQEATQERLAQAQSEGMLLRQQLEEAQNKGVAKDNAVTDAQKSFTDTLSKLRSDCEERIHLVQDRNQDLAAKAAELRERIHQLEEEKNEREANHRQVQQDLADSLKKLSMCEASLEINTRYRNDLEEEKNRLLKDVDKLKGKLEEREGQCLQAERQTNEVRVRLDERENELGAAAQKQQEALSAAAASDTTVKQLEEAMQRLEIENVRLEAAAKQQSNKLEALQKCSQEDAKVRDHLEGLVTNLQSSKMALEDQLSKEVQKQSVLSNSAQDTQAMWEDELKSRSKLGLRLAELEREKGELGSQVEIERKKAKKAAEQKNAVDSRLEQEMERNTALQKEMYRIRTLLKTAKKMLRDQDRGAGADFSSPMSSLKMELGRHSRADRSFEGRREKVNDLQGELKRGAYQGPHLDRRLLEEEVQNLKRRVESSQVEQREIEQYRHEIEEKARQEIKEKLQEVNLFLQSQAATQEAENQIKAANEASLCLKIQELESELNRTRTVQHDTLNQRESTLTELERYKELYREEQMLRKSLCADLQSTNHQLTEASSRLVNDHSRAFIASPGPLGGVVPLVSPASTLGAPYKGFASRLLSTSVAEGQSSSVEDYLAQMQRQLDRSISRELNKASAELDVSLARMSPVGSASRVELDPVSRAKQQYLEVLKKNHEI
ncbi:ankyrin repeat domain-containing protein 26-like isoform X3 [Nerophis ophidion]|uniref:ankyrin repeat domain-containing protein 26-like isoform X3 n=1 Tax=Nerophis ophidion TaxID=159077 RepID=UPI002ADFD6DF|nr:ankyrin repeat domain-containing protein 26-like isoform X3 [Nerophis ophidion]